MRHSSVITALAALAALLPLLLFSQPTMASLTGINEVRGSCAVEVRTVMATRLMERRSRQLARSTENAGNALLSGTRGATPSPPPLGMRGQLGGEWDFVDGFVVFKRNFDGVGDLEILVRGFVADREESTDRYTVPAWNRSIYWIDFDVDDATEVPRLIPALELSRNYDPTTDTVYPLLAGDPHVLAACDGISRCMLLSANFLELREVGRDYSEYPEGAAEADLIFVVDPSGQAIAAVLDIYDKNGEFERTDFLFEGDLLEIFTLGYKLDETDFVYLLTYMGERELTQNFSIQLDNYIPGVDFVDPELPEDLDAANRPLRLLLEGRRDEKGGATIEYGGPFPLGFDWKGILGFVFADGFDGLVADRDEAPTRNGLVRKRTDSNASTDTVDARNDFPTTALEPKRPLSAECAPGAGVPRR